MDVTVDTKLGKIDDKDFIDIQTSIGKQQQAIVRYIYQKTDEAIIKNMPIDILMDMFLMSKKELERRGHHETK